MADPKKKFRETLPEETVEETPAKPKFRETLSTSEDLPGLEIPPGEETLTTKLGDVAGPLAAGAVQGLTLNATDEALRLLGAEDAAQRLEELEQESPGLFLAGALPGSLATSLLPGVGPARAAIAARAGGGALGRAAAGAAEGALAGGFGAGEGEFVEGAALGGGLGGGLAAAAPAIVKGAQAAGRGAKTVAELPARALALGSEAAAPQAINAERALRAFKNLNSFELVAPRALGFVGRNAKKIEDLRKGFDTNPIAIPGAASSVIAIDQAIQAAGQRVASAPNKAGLLRQLQTTFDEVVSSPEQAITLKQVDEISDSLDKLMFNSAGNPKDLQPIWANAIEESRQQLDSVMRSVPEGKLLSTLKQRERDLQAATAQAGGLRETLAISGPIAGSMFTPVGLMGRFLSPQGYMEAMAAAKIPKAAFNTVVKPMVLAYNSNSATAIRDVVATIAEDKPLMAERLMRNIVLAANPNAEEGALLPKKKGEPAAGIRVTDPIQVQQRIKSVNDDDDIPNAKKAKIISDINKKGFFIIENPKPETFEPVKTKPKKTPDLNRFKKLLENTSI